MGDEEVELGPQAVRAGRSLLHRHLGAEHDLPDEHGRARSGGIGHQPVDREGEDVGGARPAQELGVELGDPRCVDEQEGDLAGRPLCGGHTPSHVLEPRCVDLDTLLVVQGQGER